MRSRPPKTQYPVGLPAVTTGLLAIGVIMARHYLLMVTALRAAEWPDLPRAEGGDDRSLVPLEGVAVLTVDRLSTIH
jgi:hypothetical protein